jgi:hypothetical protein
MAAFGFEADPRENEKNAEIFEQLKGDKEAIEAEFGEELH